MADGISVDVIDLSAAGGESSLHYSNLSAVQNGVLFYEICEELISLEYYSTIHPLFGSGSSSVVMRCTDNINASSMLITGWESRTWSVPVTEEKIQNYIDSVPYDAWWVDRQTVVRGFYEELIARFIDRGGSWPITSFWDYNNETWGVKKQALPEPDAINSSAGMGIYCIQVSHSKYSGIIYHTVGADGAIEEDGC